MWPDSSDAELVRRSQRGDLIASEALLRRHEQGIYRYLLGMLKSRQDAEDAAQETFVNALRALGSYEERGHFKAWIFRIAHREGLRFLRKKKPVLLEDVEYMNETVIDDWQTSDETPELKLSSHERTLYLERKIDRLPPREREVFNLRVLSDFSFREIAEITDCSINTALGRMRNAVLKLRKWVNQADL